MRAGGGSEGPESPLRGWIDPDDRLWRHPSEVAGPPTDAPAPLNAPRPLVSRRGHGAGGGPGGDGRRRLGHRAALPSSQHPLDVDGTDDTVADGSVSTLAGPQNTVPAAAAGRLGAPWWNCKPRPPHGTVTLVGVAVAEGGLVATTADLLRGVQRVVMIGPGRQAEPASVVATDAASDVALVNVPEDLPVAPFADDSSARQRGTGPHAQLRAGRGTRDRTALHSRLGHRRRFGHRRGPRGRHALDHVLGAGADDHGAASRCSRASGSVVGILYDPDPGQHPAVTFLPSDLVVGVADDLRSRDRVVHGWLGMSGSRRARTVVGPRWSRWQSHGPSTNRLVPGDVIVAVDNMPVRTMADLRARLYVLLPGTSIALSVHGASGATTTVDVTLGASP